MARTAFDPVRDAILNSPERSSHPDYPFDVSNDVQNKLQDQPTQPIRPQEPPMKSAFHDDEDAQRFTMAAEIFGNSASTPELMQNGLSSSHHLSAHESPFKAPSAPSSYSDSSASPERRSLHPKLNTTFNDFHSTPGGSAFPPTPGGFMNTPVDISLPSAYEEHGRSDQPPLIRRPSSIFSLLTLEPASISTETSETTVRSAMDIPVIQHDEQQRPRSQPVPQLKPSQPIIDKRSASPLPTSSDTAVAPSSRIRDPPVSTPRAMQAAQAAQKEPSHVTHEIVPAVITTKALTQAAATAVTVNIKRGRMYSPHNRINGPPARSIYEPLTGQEVEFYTDPANSRNPLRKGFAGASSGLSAGNRAGSALQLSDNSNSHAALAAPPTISQLPHIDPATIDVTPQYVPSRALDLSLQTRPIIRKVPKAIADGTSAARKRKRSGSPGSAIQISADGAQVAAHYNKRQNISRDDRNYSPIIGLKNFNNWIKSVLIAKYSRCDLADSANGSEGAHPVGRRRGPPIRVLDLGCGKGGDLQKWQKAGLRSLVGVDIAQVSVQQARQRWESIRGRRFPASFHALDAFSNPLSAALPPTVLSEPFDVVSMQFCMHYAFKEEEQVRQMLDNVSRYLRSGGTFLGTIPDSEYLLGRLNELPEGTDPLRFGNSVYNITFEDRSTFPSYGHRYTFFLQDAVEDVPEFIVHWDLFETLAAEYGLVPVFRRPFHDVFAENQDDTDFKDLLTRMKVVDSEGQSELDEEQWEAAGIYVAFAFVKA